MSRRFSGFIRGFTLSTLLGIPAFNSLTKPEYAIEIAQNAKHGIERVIEAPYISLGASKRKEFSRDSDKTLLARLIFGEGRECSDEEKKAIAYTPLNRLELRKDFYGRDLRDTILRNHPKTVRNKKGRKRKIIVYQYTCFDPKDKNREKVENPVKYDKKMLRSSFNE